MVVVVEEREEQRLEEREELERKQVTITNQRERETVYITSKGKLLPLSLTWSLYLIN